MASQMAHWKGYKMVEMMVQRMAGVKVRIER